MAQETVAGGARSRTPAAVEVEEADEAGDGRGDGGTAVVERRTLTVRDTAETVEDAERFVVERKAAEVYGATEVFVAETKATEVETTRKEEDVTVENDSTDCVVAVTKGDTPAVEEAFWDAVESVSDSESEEGVDEEESTEALLTTFSVATEPMDKSRGVSFSRLRHAPRLGAEPPLKPALKKSLAPVVDWRPSEDAKIGVGETVFAAWTLKDDPKETVVKEVVQEVVKEAVEIETATIPDLVGIVSDLSMADGTPEAKYSRPFTDLELETI
ncbi:hypothetical protein PInf_013819 [Phytophthora infestans]|nr:hypothetical protein PInf_013819 [Phytophthora infestans]